MDADLVDLLRLLGTIAVSFGMGFCAALLFGPFERKQKRPRHGRGAYDEHTDL